MQQSTLNRVFVVGLAILAFWLLAGTYMSTTNGTPAWRSGTTHADKIPFNLRDMDAAGGWDKLSPRQREWAWAKYRHDLISIRQTINNLLLHRQATNPNFKLTPQFAQMNSAIQLLTNAISDVESGGPDEDPTKYQSLIDQCIEAIKR
jgi:hypothetical protein